MKGLRIHWSAFTLVELLVSMTLFAFIMTLSVAVLSQIGETRLRVSEKYDMNRDLYLAIEQMATSIKEGGEIDYEEYFNRDRVGTAATASGHYSVFSGYGNFGAGFNFTTPNYGNWFYFCASGDAAVLGAAAFMWTGWCVTAGPQRFGEYTFQFIDFNGNMDADGGDQNGDGNIRWDHDDENLGTGPRAFSGANGQIELYLINKTTQERIFFRRIVRVDPKAPPGATCDTTGLWSGSGCLGNIQILRLVGRDYGHRHTTDILTTSPGRYDGTIDTWECRTDFRCGIPQTVEDGWIDLFPNDINVKDIRFFPYPEKDYRYAWKETDNQRLTAPYVRFRITLDYGWGKKIGMQDTRRPKTEMTISSMIALE